MSALLQKSKFLYFFQGGDGLQHVATNNPLYITDNPDGGHGLKTDYEKERETIFAGVYVINSSINGFLHFFVIRFQPVFFFFFGIRYVQRIVWGLVSKPTFDASQIIFVGTVA